MAEKMENVRAVGLKGKQVEAEGAVGSNGGAFDEAGIGGVHGDSNCSGGRRDGGMGAELDGAGDWGWEGLDNRGK